MLITLNHLKTSLQALKDYVVGMIPGRTSDLMNDSGYITEAGVTSFNGSTGDVTYSSPVTSVNSQMGDVTLVIPEKTSDIVNDNNFITIEEVPLPDWEAESGEDGYIDNKPNIHVGDGTDSVVFSNNDASGYRAFASGANSSASGFGSFATGNASNCSVYLTGDAGATTYSYGNVYIIGNSAAEMIRAGTGFIYVGDNEIRVTGIDTTARTITTEYTLSSEAISNQLMLIYLKTTASGDTAFGNGIGVLASGEGAHAEGSGTIAKNAYQHVFGTYNVKDTSDNLSGSKGDYAEIVGNGTSSTRSNARTLDWSGNEWLSGTLKVGGSSYSDAEEVAVKSDIPDVPVQDVYVDDASVLSNGIATIPKASLVRYGVVKPSYDYGTNIQNSSLVLVPALSSEVENGTHQYKPIVPYHQHEAVFYGLAKVAGDSTQVSSGNTLGTYTESAKGAIKSMLGITDPSTITMEGTAVTITGQPNTRYKCGEVYSLSITPPESGIMNVVFTSGSSATILDLPNTVKMPEWWIGPEEGYIYEISILDGVYGTVMSWQA